MKNSKIAVITGDIMNSRSIKTAKWQSLFKGVLGHFGKEFSEWELYRGDSFQLALSPKESLLAAIQLKACIKQLAGLDIRMCIGIGEMDYRAKKITASTGSAFVYSGEGFDLIKKQLICINTSNKKFMEQINLMLELALLTMNNWTPNVATVISATLEHSNLNQMELAELLQKSQSNISETLSRGGFEEIEALINYYQKYVVKL